jgi:hypothetical protein
MVELLKRRLDPRISSKDYRKYLQYLRCEFRFRCGYCGAHESDLNSETSFEIDHFRPKSVKAFARLATSYKNLYYACASCNRHKRACWPSRRDEGAGYGFVDPCAEPLIGTHAELGDDGELVPSTKIGEFTIHHLGLNRVSKVRLRRARARAYEDFARAISALTSQIDDLEGLWHEAVDADVRARISNVIRKEREARSALLQKIRFVRLPLDE